MHTEKPENCNALFLRGRRLLEKLLQYIRTYKKE